MDIRLLGDGDGDDNVEASDGTGVIGEIPCPASKGWGGYLAMPARWHTWTGIQDFSTDGALDKLELVYNKSGKANQMDVYKFEIRVTYAGAVTPKASSDSGTGADAKSDYPAATFTKEESGTGAEGSPAQEAALAGAESGSGADAPASQAAELIGPESGVGSDLVASQMAEILAAELGSGTEGIADRSLVIPESGVGVESSFLRKSGRERVEGGEVVRHMAEAGLI